MKLLTIILTLLSGVVWAEPLKVTIYIVPSDDSLLTTNVDTVKTQSYKNTVVIGEVLDSNTSFQAVRSGPRGQQTSVFTRGTNSNNTLFMINGSPVTDHSTTNSLFDAGVDSVTYADSVDLYKGSQSTLWGPGAIGGAININTGGALEDSVTVKGGSNNTAGVGINYFTAQPSGI
ncbi:MAG: TonB-dependent receptor plug domain-containing protein, partial [Candidatus Poseidoniales archaeon]